MTHDMHNSRLTLNKGVSYMSISPSIPEQVKY